MKIDVAITTCHCWGAAILLATLIAISGAEAQTRNGTQPEKLRTYADGPLTVEDFAAQAPENPPVNLGIEMVANTQCVVRYDYRTAVEQRGRDQWTARITSFTSVAVIDPAKCWLTSRDSRVLDHEQGHFDLAELAARRMQQHFADLIRNNNAVVGGRDRRTAERKLHADIKKATEEVYQWLAEAQKTYDEQTRHGTLLSAQRLHRQWQRAELEKSTAAK
jgi:hypothetical protein